MFITEITLLWLFCAIVYVLNLATLPKSQRFSHPASVVCGAFLAVMLDGIIVEQQLLNGDTIRNLLLKQSFLNPSMELHVAAYLTLMFFCRYKKIEEEPEPDNINLQADDHSRQYDRIMLYVAISAVMVNVVYWFGFTNLKAVLFHFQGGRGAVLEETLGSEDTFIHRYGIQIVYLGTFIGISWALVRPIVTGTFSWKPVLIAIMPLTVGVVTTSRHNVFQIVVPLILLFLLLRPQASLLKVAGMATLAIASMFIIVMLRNTDESGIIGLYKFVSTFSPDTNASIHATEGVTGGAIAETSGAMYYVADRGYIGAWNILLQMNILPTFMTGASSNTLWFQGYFGISTVSIGITVPVLPDLYLDIGWWGILFYAGLGWFLNFVYRKAVWSRNSLQAGTRIFPAWIVFYVMCMCSCLLMWHSGIRGFYRLIFDSAIICYCISRVTSAFDRTA